MKNQASILLICIAFLTGFSMKAQSFIDLIAQSEQVKVEYGETDDRYLDALSRVIQTAFDEQKSEEANHYRQIHADIVKEKYGENSLEYAEDLWRLGNVSRYKGEQYQFDCYKKAQKILETIDAKDSFVYFNLFLNYFRYYWNQQKWNLAAINIQKFIDYATPWVNKEWKGNTVRYVSIANAYYLLGVTYYSHLKNYVSAIEAFKECTAIVEGHQLLQQYPDVLLAYQGVWLGYENIQDYTTSLEWHYKSIAATAELKGDTSDEYLEEISALRYCYYSLGDYDSTVETNLTLLAKIEKRDTDAGVNPVNDTLFVNEYEHLVQLGIIFKRYPEVIKYGFILSDIYKVRGEEDTESYLSLLENLLLAYHNTHNYLDEYSLFDQYEILSNRIDHNRTEDYCSYLGLKAECLTNLYKFDEYDKTIDELTTLTFDLYGANSIQSLQLSSQVADQAISRGDLDGAKKGVESFYRILKSGECVFENRIDSLIFMATIHKSEGNILMSTDLETAENKLLLSSKELDECCLPSYEPLVDLGLLEYQYKRDFRKAREYFELAKQSLENAGDNYSVQYITVLNDLGLCCQELGMSSLAIAIWDVASQTILTNYGKQHVLYGTIEQNKSVFYTHISNYPEAIKSCNEAIDCFRQVYGEHSEKYAMCIQNLGLMYQYVGDFAKSKELLRQAIFLLEELGSVFCIHAYSNLMGIYAVEKDFDQLADLADKAETILMENHWEETDVAAALYGSIGYAMLINGASGAKAHLKYALSLLNANGGTNTPAYHIGLLYYGLASFLDQSQTEEIIPVLINSYKNQYLRNIAFFNGNERESLITGPRFSQTKNIIFSSRKEGKQDSQLYDFILFNKGLLLGTSIGYAKAIYDSGNEELISKYERLTRLNRYLNGESISELNILSIDEAREQSSALEREITLYLRQNSGYTESLHYTYLDIQKALGEKEVAVEFVSFLNYADNDTYYAALIARKDWQEPKYVSLCKKDDLEKIVSLSPDRLYGKTTASENAFNLIWEPLIPYLKDAHTVYFSPAGYVNKIAIEHLYNGNKRFDSMFNVVRLSSTREICGNNSKYKYAKAILYGGLKYDEDDATMIAESRNIRGATSSQLDIFKGDDNSTRKGWEYLPGTLVEVNRISSIISKNRIDCDIYTSSKGNEESFKALSGNNFGILHIATHGFYMTPVQAQRNDFFTANPFVSQSPDSIESPLLRSGLLMAGGNKAWKGEPVPYGIEDGILTAAEIATLDLSSCDIVVLSACETGLGEITDEGVYGLQRAFKNAGVNTIIMSLWEVDDQATSLMMQTFYRNLVQGKGKRESFTAAQNEVKKKYKNPRYWAAFIMLD